MEPGQSAQVDTSDTGDLLPLVQLKCSKGRGRGEMRLARGKEEINNEAACQVLQERKKESYLPVI